MNRRNKRTSAHPNHTFFTLTVLFFLLISCIGFSGTGTVPELGAADGPNRTIENKEIVNSVYIPLKRPASTNNSSWQRNVLQDTNAVLAELYTATWCQPCVKADEALEELMDEEEYYSRERFNVLFYHPHPDSREEDPFGTPTGQERIGELYGFNSFPSVAFNGIREEIGAPEDVQNRYIDHIHTLLSKKNIVAFEGDISVVERHVELDITVKATSYVHPIKLKFVVILMEDHLHFNGSNGITDHRNVVREIYTEEEFQLTSSPRLFQQGIMVDDAWNMSNCSLVVFAQSTEQQSFGGEGGAPKSAAGDDESYLPYIGLGIAVVAGAFLALMLLTKHREKTDFMDNVLKERVKRLQATSHACDICGKGFPSKDVLKKHTREEHFTSCPVCGVKLKESNVDWHLKKVHK